MTQATIHKDADQATKGTKRPINRRAILSELDSMAGDIPRDDWRAAMVQILQRHYEEAFAQIRSEFLSVRSGGLEAAQRLSYVVDQILRCAFDFISGKLYPGSSSSEGDRIALIAVGGYGRGELAPYSDIDLMFVLPYKATPRVEQVIEATLYTLWDMGLKVSHSVRRPEDIDRLARADLTIFTALLEARFVWGDQELSNLVNKHFRTELLTDSSIHFVEEKLDERDARHARQGDSRYMVEPNIKDGKGGLRDLQTMWWIVRYLKGGRPRAHILEKGLLSASEYRQFTKAERFLWTVRFALHYASGRANERLSFDYQRQLAEQLGYKSHPGTMAVERFMKHYFYMAKGVGDLTRVLCAVLEHQEKKKSRHNKYKLPTHITEFQMLDGRLAFKDKSVLGEDATALVRIFAVAEDHGLDIHPDSLRLIRQNTALINEPVRQNMAAGKAFMTVLTSTKRQTNTLRRMNECGVFGRFLPDFGRVVGQMQYDLYHHYTVDEHTIQALMLLKKIERGELKDDHPLASEIIDRVVSRQVLYLAVLFHDIAKGREGDHSIIGAEIARQHGARLGLKPAETETVAWLVRWHLYMSDTAFKRDIADPKTVEDFAAHVKSPERLRLLLILTVVDIRAVGPGVWNGWKGQLLRDLYYSAEEYLLAGHAGINRAERVAARKQDLAERVGQGAAELKPFLSRWRDAYWIGEDSATIEANLKQIQKAEHARPDGTDGISIDFRFDPFRAVTRLGVYTKDRIGLFARIVGGISRAGAVIVDAKVHTATDGMAMDNFLIQGLDGKAISRPEDLARLDTSISDALKSRRLSPVAASRTGLQRHGAAAFDVPSWVLIDNKASNHYTVIEVSARDCPGLLFDLAYSLYKLKLDLSSAHIATYGERAVDVFYVTERHGGKATHGRRKANIEKTLLAAAERKSDPEAKA